jgi:hypothetical protein
MPASMPSLSNFLIHCLVLILLHHWSLFIQMCGVLLLIPLVIRNTMLVSSMILVVSHGFIFFTINLRCLNSFKNFNALLSECSTVKLLLCRLIGVASMSGSTPFLAPLEYPIMYHVFTPINKMARQSGNISILSRWGFSY